MTEPVGFGAQAERTALSWQRTGLAAVAVGALAARTTAPAAGVVLVLVGVLAAGVVAPVRYARIRAGAGAAPGLLLTAAALVLGTLAGIVAELA